MIKDLNKKILKLITVFAIILPTFYEILSVCLVELKIINNFDNINPAMILYMFIPFLIYIYIIDLIKIKRKLDIYDYVFYTLIISGILSTIFSIDKSIAVFGKEFRHEGLLSVMSYYLLFINWKVNGDKKSCLDFIKFLILIGIINSIYALLQVYTSFDFILKFGADSKMAIGFYGNPNFYGSLIVTVIFILTCNIFINKKMKLLDLILLILFFISLINCQSTGPFLAFLITFIFNVIFFILKNINNYKKILLQGGEIIIIFLLIFFCVTIINKNVNNYDKCEICNVENTIKSGGAGRVTIWKNSLDIVKNNLVFGVGFDNFHLAYPNPKLPSSIIFIIDEDEVKVQDKIKIIDNAHNVYLHTLVSTGIIGFIPYMALIILVFLKGIKEKKIYKLPLFIGFVAYSIQAFTNINVVTIAPIYFIIMGLISSKE